MRRLALFAACALHASPAAAELVVGYQLSAEQSVGTTATDNETEFVLTASSAGVPPVQRLTGIRLDTIVAANLTLDIITGSANHAFLLGAAFNQLVPVDAPMELRGNLRDALTGVTANASYLAQITRPTWGFGLGGGYAFASNGRLALREDGSQAAAGAPAGTLPGQELGPFAVNGQSHAITGRTNYQILSPNWDLDLRGDYTFAKNGIFTLDGAQGGLQDQNALRTNLGEFIPATAHTIAIAATHRGRVARRNNLVTNLESAWVVPVDDDGVTQDAMGNPRVGQVLPETINFTLEETYRYDFTQERGLGADASGTFTLRSPVDRLGFALRDENGRDILLAPDTLIWQARLTYQDRIRWGDLRLNFAAGVAQPRLLQAPLGTEDVNNDGVAEGFETVTGNIEPIFELAVQRRFEPIEVGLTAVRTVAVGALGASSVVAMAAGLTLRHVWEIDQDRTLTTDLGFNLARSRGVGRDLFQLGDRPVQVGFDNDSAGANAGLEMRLFRAGDLDVNAELTYNLLIADLDPQRQQLRPVPGCVDTDPNPRVLMTLPECVGLEPFMAHTALFTVRVLFGRGTLGGAGRPFGGELDRFAVNPETGAPLTTSRLTERGARMLDGTAGASPGREADATSVREVYEAGVRQQRIEAEARARAAQAEGDQAVDEGEEQAREEDEAAREEAREKRTREFGEWPMQLGKPGAKVVPPPAAEEAETTATPPPPPSAPPQKPAKPRKKD